MYYFSNCKRIDWNYFITKILHIFHNYIGGFSF